MQTITRFIQHFFNIFLPIAIEVLLPTLYHHLTCKLSFNCCSDTLFTGNSLLIHFLPAWQIPDSLHHFQRHNHSISFRLKQELAINNLVPALGILSEFIFDQLSSTPYNRISNRCKAKEILDGCQVIVMRCDPARSNSIVTTLTSRIIKSMT